MPEFTPFPILQSERLVLRKVNLKDKNEIFALRSNERVNEFLDRQMANSLTDAIEFINKITRGIANNELLYWGICFKNEKKLIGTICYWNISREFLSAEIGYELHPDYHGKGIMKEAISKVIEYGSEVISLKSIEACLHPKNTQSIKLLERNGFQYKGVSNELVVYSIINK